MKTLKFFAVVIAAFAMLVACEPQETPTTDDNKPGTNDTTAVDTVPTLPPTQELEKVAIDLVWGSATEINGKVFEVGMANYDELFYEMIFSDKAAIFAAFLHSIIYDRPLPLSIISIFVLLTVLLAIINHFMTKTVQKSTVYFYF